jgi:hypothetical protein
MHEHDKRGEGVDTALEHVAADMANDELLAAIDVVLLELERRLLRYAVQGQEILGMADEGLVLAVRSAARIRQALSASQHTTGHLQVVGVGGWRPRRTTPGWADDPRIADREQDTGEEPNDG